MQFSTSFNEQIYRGLARRVRHLRRLRGITMATLAYRCDLQPGSIANIERCHRKPSLAALKRIASGLRVPLENLVRIPMPETGGGRSRKHLRRILLNSSPGDRKALARILGAIGDSCAG